MHDYMKMMKLIDNEQAIVVHYDREEEPEQKYYYDHGYEEKEG